MGVAIQEVSEALQKLEAQRRALETQCGRAWVERDQCLAAYHSALRGIVQALDDCESASASPPMAALARQLGDVLKEHGVQPLVTREADAFDPRLHTCEEAVAGDARHPPGTVARVIQKGYVQLRADGGSVVIRPAKVQAARASS